MIESMSHRALDRSPAQHARNAGSESSVAIGYTPGAECAQTQG